MVPSFLTRNRSLGFSRKWPIMDAWMPDRSKLLIIVFANLGLADISKAPELISCNGSILKYLHISTVS